MSQPQLGATSGLWQVTGNRLQIWWPDTDSKSYQFPFSDSSPRLAERAGVQAASHWKQTCITLQSRQKMMSYRSR